MRPILLKGHTRPLTQAIYNREGDLIFTSSKDNSCQVWYSDNGERIGTYDGHGGAVWSLDVNWDSTLLLSAGADMNAKMWDVRSGNQLVNFIHSGPVRWVQWAEGGRLFVTCNDPFSGRPAAVSVYEINKENPSSSSTQPLFSIPLPSKAYAALWLPLNASLVLCCEDGCLRKLDVQTGQLAGEPIRAHESAVLSAAMNIDKTLFITTSSDHKAKLWDADSLEALKTYETDRNVNSAAIHPTRPHVLLGGGQDAMDVTTTGGSMGKFETRFFHMVFETEFGRVKGHFGPIHTVAIHPNGSRWVIWSKCSQGAATVWCLATVSFISGSEDGFARLHMFDDDYWRMKDELEVIMEAEQRREARAAAAAAATAATTAASPAAAAAQ